MKKMIVLFFGLLISSGLFSCASGTALVTGTQRPAIAAEEVAIYTEAPKDYEVIGIVTASSDSGFTEQGDMNYAVAELKKQAAKIGANGVLLESVTTSNSGGVITYNFGFGMFAPVTAKNLSGKAIYVEK